MATCVTYIDVHVGKRLRRRRRLLGLSQTALANMVGVRFQAIQKYEAAKNKMSAGRLYQVAKALDVGVEFFFEGLDGNSGAEDIAKTQEG